MSTETHPANAWRTDIARPIGAAYAANPKVAAVIIGGSTARGYADRYSDIEIGVFWQHPPSDEDRRAAAKASGAEIHGLYPYDETYEVWEDALFVGRAAPDQPGTGILVEIPHYKVEFIERTFSEVIDHFDPSEDKLNLIAAFPHAIVIKGESLIEEWQSRIKSYPRDLTLAVVRRHAQIEFLWRSDMFLDRGHNLMLLHEMFVQIGKKLCHIVFALNRTYYPGFKWVYHLVAQMPITPPDFYARLQRIFESDPSTAADDLRSLVEEVYNLIERELPEIDIEIMRKWFRYRRHLWDSPPPNMIV